MRQGESFTAPQQHRSRKTLDKILYAAEKLLDEKPFDQISVADIIAIAKVSAGSFYARFPEKDALLDMMCANYLDKIEKEIAKTYPLKGHFNLKEGIEKVVDFVSQNFLENRGVILSMLSVYRFNSLEIINKYNGRVEAIYIKLMEILGGENYNDLSQKQQKCVGFSTFLIMATLRDRLIYTRSPVFSLKRKEFNEIKEDLENIILLNLKASKIKE